MRCVPQLAQLYGVCQRVDPSVQRASGQLHGLMISQRLERVGELLGARHLSGVVEDRDDCHAGIDQSGFDLPTYPVVSVVKPGRVVLRSGLQPLRSNHHQHCTSGTDGVGDAARPVLSWLGRFRVHIHPAARRTCAPGPP
jgi:hypothetical protein